MSYQVLMEPQGATIQVKEGQNILDAALRAGVHIPHVCGHGLCSACKIDVLKGKVDFGDASSFALVALEREEGKALACCATPMSDLLIETAVYDDKDTEAHIVRDFTGVVSKIETYSSRIKGIFIAIEKDGIEFQAGQYVSIKIPGLKRERRTFSIASPPSERNLVELNVCLIPDGEGTRWLHSDLKVGDELSFSGPYGQFHAHRSQPGPMLFIAGGSGLSCIKSIILDLFEKGEARPITLIYGARNQEELYYRELFGQLAEEHGNFTYLPVLSDEPENSSWSGRRGLVSTVAREQFEQEFAGSKAYMCGPPPMIESCIETLKRGGLLERDMYMENFYTEADRYRKPASLALKSN